MQSGKKVTKPRMVADHQQAQQADGTEEQARRSPRRCSSVVRRAWEEADKILPGPNAINIHTHISYDAISEGAREAVP